MTGVEASLIPSTSALLVHRAGNVIRSPKRIFIIGPIVTGLTDIKDFCPPYQ